MNLINLVAQATSLAGGVAAHAAEAAPHMEGATEAVAPFVSLFAIFLMAVFVGYYVIWNVTPALHSPLMALTNGISSVIIVGALLVTGLAASAWAVGFGFLAVMLASVNIFGGFLVTYRMLAMFKSKKKV
jgi:H+-translocating NAD(P) transhydrogenase subunit alpha